MWRTQYGDRILIGAEARVFAEALLNLLDEVTEFDFDDYELGVKCFDTLTFGQKISVLATIGNGLFRKDVPPVELTAVLEGAIAAVFEHLKKKIIIEIDDPEPDTDWRELVVAARKETEGEESEREEIPEPMCTDLDKWETEVEELSDGILWDVDYEDEDLYIDKPPEEAQALKDFMRMRDDYFSAIADDLTDEEAEARIKELRKLCNPIIKPC
jgi:hypothetical protein